MKIEFDAKEVEEILLKEAQRYDPKLNRVRGADYRSIPGVTVCFEKPIDIEAEQALLNIELGLPA